MTKSSCWLMLLLSVAAATGKEDGFAPVKGDIRTRTGAELRWDQEEEARSATSKHVHELLRRPMTLDSAVQVALLHNPALQAEFEEIGLSLADLREARLVANPQASLEVKLPDRPPSAASLEWNIAQNFLSLLALPLRTRVARERLAGVQAKVGSSVLTLVSQVKIAWYELQANAALLDRLQTIQAAQSASLQLSQKLQEAGNIPDLALAREQAAYSQMRLEISRSQADGRALREKMNRLLGTWGTETGWVLAGQLPPLPERLPPLGKVEELAVANRLDLASARTTLTSSARALGLEKQFRYVAVLDFGMAGEREPDGTNLTGPSLQLELPIFNQGQARLARGASALRIAQRRFESLAIEIRSEVRELRDRLISRYDMARLYQEDLAPMRRLITSQTLLQYNAMLVGAFDAFQARRDDLEAERGLVEATRDFWTTRADLERALGGSFSALPPHVEQVQTPKTKTVSKRKSKP